MHGLLLFVGHLLLSVQFDVPSLSTKMPWAYEVPPLPKVMSLVDISKEAVAKERAQAGTGFAFMQAIRRNGSIAAWKDVNEMMHR